MSRKEVNKIVVKSELCPSETYTNQPSKNQLLVDRIIQRNVDLLNKSMENSVVNFFHKESP